MLSSDLSTATTHRLDWLDALRGWAVLGVVLVHTGFSLHIDGASREGAFWQTITSSGQYGVQLFFVVSALTISITYESHLAKFGSGVRTAASWFIKRFFRIAPLYYFAILFYAAEQSAIYIGSHHKYGQLPNAIPDILANVAFVHAWIPSANNNVVPGGWSIGVEMFFYVLVPLIWGISKQRLRMLLLALAIIPALAISFFTSFITQGSFYVSDNTFLYYWFPTQYPVFALGLIYYLVAMKSAYRPQARHNSAVFFGAFVGLSCVGLMFGAWKELAPVLSPLFVGAAFICLIESMHGVVKKILVNSVVTFLGRVSYSIYIFHFFVIDAYKAVVLRVPGSHHSPYWIFVVFPGVVIVTSGIAFISKRLLEDPGIGFGHYLSKRVASLPRRQIPA